MFRKMAGFSTWRQSLWTLLGALLSLTPVLAVDGVIEINQARALAGGVTSGDSPGFPVTLSEPGSYRLTGNLHTDSKDVTAISVEADNVTVDLNGFTIACTFVSEVPAACTANATGSGYGIVGVGYVKAAVKNGSIEYMGADGIYLDSKAQVTNMRTEGNGRNGIRVEGSSIVSGNISHNNKLIGILAYQSCTITGNITTLNDLFGISANAGSLVISNSVKSNGSFGLSFSNALGFTGYQGNALIDNNGGNANPQVSGGIELGTNLCGTNTSCP